MRFPVTFLCTGPSISGILRWMGDGEMSMKYRKSLKLPLIFLSRLLVFCLMICLMRTVAFGGTLTDTEVRDLVEDGVVKVRITFRANDKIEEHKVVRYQTGFMIGDGSQTSHVITAYAGLHATAAELDAWKEEWLDAEGKYPEIGNPTVEVIQNWDVIVTGSVASESERAGVSIISLTGNKSAELSLPLAGTETAPAGTVYLCTFPDTEGDRLAFSEQSVYFMKGDLLQIYGQGDEALLEYDIHPDLRQAAGSPVFDTTGSVIGMHTGINENGNSSAVGIGAVRKLLDQNKIAYVSYHASASGGKKTVLPVILGIVAAVLIVVSAIQIIRGSLRKKEMDLEKPEYMPRLVRISTGETIVIDKTPFCLGSSTDGTDHVVTGNRKISRRHVLIVGDLQHLFLVDLSSSNGTALNRRPLEPELQYPLHHGDEVWLADEEFAFLQNL